MRRPGLIRAVGAPAAQPHECCGRGDLFGGGVRYPATRHGDPSGSMVTVVPRVSAVRVVVVWWSTVPTVVEGMSAGGAGVVLAEAVKTAAPAMPVAVA
ncbi:hypothetical protein OG470_06225 [Micromonospora sp. NBC_00389]|uniref:hypothetical protein n=1 Tax=Micromonospora sp. NBC_00389 TaxID=2903586 RepID=UPI002E21D2DA